MTENEKSLTAMVERLIGDVRALDEFINTGIAKSQQRHADDSLEAAKALVRHVRPRHHHIASATHFETCCECGKDIRHPVHFRADPKADAAATAEYER